jgi:hypothetical protein
MQFAGASAQAQISGDTELNGKINHLTGNDPAQWHTGVAMFAKVRVSELYPGVNLVYYGNQQQLEYDFTIAPGAKPDAIAIRFDGVDTIAANAKGELVLTLGDAEIRQPKPVLYQMVGGARHEINGGYRLVDARTVAFDVGPYDRTLPLVIDPILSHSTYFGGNSGDTAWAVAVDTNGFIYVAGQTFSSRITNNVPLARPGAYQTNFHGGTFTGDAFVAKFDNVAQNLIYFTYLGGSADDLASSIAVDGQGNAYVTGFTDSPDFPITNAITGHAKIGGSYSQSFGFYPIDAFVAKLNSGGSNLMFSTYLGGSGMDGGDGIALDSSGNIYVTGYTFSTNFPATNAITYRLAGRTNTVLDHLACTNTIYFNANAFIAKIGGPGGTNLIYSSYFGGNNFDAGESIAVDSSNFVYVTGFTASTNFPNTNSFRKYLNGSTNQTPAYDAFVAKFDATGTNLLYSTFLGGTNNDVACSIAVDNQGAAYVTGWTTSTNFPNTNSAPGLYNGLVNSQYAYLVTNVFLTKITNGTGTNYAGIACSTLFGGTNIDIGYGVAVAAGYVFVAGSTSSTNFPTSNLPGLLRATNSGGNDAFVAAFTISTFAPVYSVCLGGNSDDFAYGIAADPVGNAYIVGQTLSPNFPTLNARQTTLNGTNDAFLTEIILFVSPPVITSPTNQIAGVGEFVTMSASVTGTPPFFFQWQKDGTNLMAGTTSGGSTISGTTNETLTISGAQTNDIGNYRVIATNYVGSATSSVAVLTVVLAPVLTVQPVSQTVGVGSTVIFSIDGFAESPFYFQWLKNGNNLTNGTTIGGSTVSGSTNFALTISNAQTNDTGNYWLIVTNNWGSATSSVAVLTVYQSPLFGSIIVAPGVNGGFILSGVGGTNNGAYYVLTTTNLPLPLTNWTRIATNHFDGTGHFIFTNIAPTQAPQEFYLLQMP